MRRSGRSACLVSVRDKPQSAQRSPRRRSARRRRPEQSCRAAPGRRDETNCRRRRFQQTCSRVTEKWVAGWLSARRILKALRAIMAAEAGSAESAVRSALYRSRSADDAERGHAEQTLDGFARVPGALPRRPLWGPCAASWRADSKHAGSFSDPRGAPGYGHCLASVMASQSDPVPLRQLSGLVLRRFVRRYWMDPEATGNALSDAEKQAIREILLPLLRERSSLLRRAAVRAPPPPPPLWRYFPSGNDRTRDNSSSSLPQCPVPCPLRTCSPWSSRPSPPSTFPPRGRAW